MEKGPPTKVHESSCKNVTKSNVAGSIFGPIWGRNQLLRRETIFLVEFAGNELNSLVFIKFYVFALISTQGITQDFLEGSELASSEKKLKFHDFTQDNQRGTAPHRLLLISNFKRPGQKCFIFCFFLIET